MDADFRCAISATARRACVPVCNCMCDMNNEFFEEKDLCQNYPRTISGSSVAQSPVEACPIRTVGFLAAIRPDSEITIHSHRTALNARVDFGFLVKLSAVAARRAATSTLVVGAKLVGRNV